MSNIKAQQFCITGPPVMLVEGLFDSGLVNKSDFHSSKEKKETNSSKKTVNEKTISRLSGIDKNGKQTRATSSTRPQTNHLAIPQIKRNEKCSNSSHFAMQSHRLLSSYKQRTCPYPLSTGNIFKQKNDIDDALLPPSKVPFARKESQTLLHKFKLLTKEIDTLNINNLSPEEQISAYEKFIATYFILFNDIILQLKGYNQDYSVMLLHIKKFFQDTLDRIPEVSKKFQSEIDSLRSNISLVDEENKNFEVENDFLKRRNTENDEIITKLKSEIAKCNERIKSLMKEKSMFEMENEDIRMKNNETIYKLGKTQKTNSSLEFELEKSKRDNEEYKGVVGQLEELVKKYESEGASYMPLYNKSVIENENLMNKLNLANAKLSEYESRINNRREIGIDPVFVIEETVKSKGSGQKKKQKNVGGSKSIKKLSVTKEESVKKSKKSVDENIDSSLERISLSSLHKKINLSENNIETSQHIIVSSDSTCVLFTELPAGSLEIIPLNDNSSINLSDKEEKKEELKEENSEEILISSEDNTMDELPNDYSNVVSVITANNSVISSYINRLLPTEYRNNNNNNDFIQFHEISKNVHVKEFLWTLKNVLSVMREGISTIKLPDNDVTFKQVIFDVLRKYYSNDFITQTNVDCLLTSVVHYSSVSQTIDFFMKFLVGEYSILSFMFFSVIFGIALPLLYPNVENTVSDPDYNEDSSSFTIHTSNANKIAEIIFGIKELPPKVLQKLMKNAPNQDYPTLLSFWQYSSEMIEMFDKMHKEFHTSINNLLLISGNINASVINELDFNGFIKIVLPEVKAKKIKEMWKSIVASSCNSGALEVSRFVFLDWIGDNSEIAEAIVALPDNTEFKTHYRQLGHKLESLFEFIKSRYISFIPNVIQLLRDESKKRIVPYVYQMRKAIIKCDVSSCYTIYRYIMQTIDLMITQNNPFVVFVQDITNEEIEKLIDYIKLREKIASFAIGFDD